MPAHHSGMRSIRHCAARQGIPRRAASVSPKGFAGNPSRAKAWSRPDFPDPQGLSLMSSAMSQASLAVFEIGLNALAAVLDKAEAHASAKKIDPLVLTSWRLAP